MPLAWSTECGGGSDQRTYSKKRFCRHTGFARIRINAKMREAKGDSKVCD